MRIPIICTNIYTAIAITLIMVLVVGLDRILTYNDTLHKTEYRVVQNLFEPVSN